MTEGTFRLETGRIPRHSALGLGGFEAVNSSTPAACRTAIKEALNLECDHDW